jgi:C4-dicarboxylate transporter DctM subunit
MGIVSFGGLCYLMSSSAALAKMAHVPFTVASSYDYAPLLLFIFMGHIIFTSGIGKDLYNLAAKWLGHYPGGLAMATAGACAGFAAVSASSLASAATMGLISIPEMRKHKYDPALATGCVAAAGTMGALIPPSGALIIYGLITESSIGKLFMAGIIPGILEALFYITAILILCRWKPSLGPRGPKFGLREKIMAFGSCGEVAVLIVFVLGGLILGWFTPTEAGAMGAFGAIVVSLARKRLSWNKFKEALTGSVKTGGMIFGILIGAMLFKQFTAATTIPFMLAEFLSGLSISPWLIIFVIIVVYFFLGCIMDAMAMILLTIPIFFPLILSLGFNPIWFGIIVVRMTEIGAITPPLGMNVYVISGVAPDVPMQTIFRGIIPFLIADLANVALMVFVPGIVLFLPNLLF